MSETATFTFGRDDQVTFGPNSATGGVVKALHLDEDGLQQFLVRHYTTDGERKHTWFREDELKLLRRQ